MQIKWNKITDKNSFPKIHGDYLVTDNRKRVISASYFPNMKECVEEWILNYTAWSYYPSPYEDN